MRTAAARPDGSCQFFTKLEMPNIAFGVRGILRGFPAVLVAAAVEVEAGSVGTMGIGP